jgi:DNA-binding transcriptional LysR family regulator
MKITCFTRIHHDKLSFMIRLDSHLIPSFLAVADCLNFTEAASKLGATQSGLSQHIAKLEATLGSDLFIRTNKKVFLTPSGIAFRKFAESYIEHESNLFHEILGEKGALIGEVRYAMPESCLMTSHLTQLLKKRSEKFPDLKLKVTIAGHEEILRMVLENEIDFGFCTQTRPWPGLTFTPYCMEESVLVGRKEFLKNVTSLNDLSSVPFLMHPDFTEVMESWWKKYRPRQNFPELQVAASLNNFQGIKALLLNGAGVAILPKQCVEMELGNKQLVELLPSLKPVYNQVSLATLTSAALPQRVKRVMDEFHLMIN